MRPTPAPIRAVPPPGAAAPRPATVSIDLELPSPDALQDARARAGQPPPVEPELALEEELSPLPEEPPRPAAAGASLSPAEQAILAALHRLAEGGHAEPEVVKPTQAIAVLIRILLRKGLVSERELLDALRKG